MVLLWFFDAALIVLGWGVAFFGFASPLVLPAPPAIVVPVPYAGSAGVSALNGWWPVAVGVSVALAVGAGLQWLYGLIPFKAT